MKNILKALIMSETAAMVGGTTIWGASTALQQVSHPSANHLDYCVYNDYIAAFDWLMLILLRTPIFFVLLPILFYSHPCFQKGDRTLQEKIFKSGCIIGLSAAMSLAVTCIAFSLFHKYILETFNPDPKVYPSGVIECEGSSLAFQFAGQVGISALGPLSFFTVFGFGTRCADYLKQRADERTKAERQAILHDEADRSLYINLN